MTRGKVVDPDQGDRADSKWGYIERYDEQWPGTNINKVIPFKNKDSSLPLNAEVEFDVDQVDPDKGKAKLAVAKNVKPFKE